MEEAPTTVKTKSGCAPLTIFIIILVIVAAIFGIDEGLGQYGLHCGDMPILDCINAKSDEDALSEEQRKSLAVATGPYSYSDYSIVLTMKIPLSGGPVTGAISGACGGKVTGSFGGKNKGGISGRIAGTCGAFMVNIPASAIFNGIVNKDGKSVPISFSGKGGGFTHDGSMSLSY